MDNYKALTASSLIPMVVSLNGLCREKLDMGILTLQQSLSTVQTLVEENNT